MFTKEKLEEVTVAKKQILEGSFVIWRARLESLANAGSSRGVFNILQSPVEPQEANNCNCTNTVAGCGQPAPVNDFSSLPPPPD